MSNESPPIGETRILDEGADDSKQLDSLRQAEFRQWFKEQLQDAFKEQLQHAFKEERQHRSIETVRETRLSLIVLGVVTMCAAIVASLFCLSVIGKQQNNPTFVLAGGIVLCLLIMTWAVGLSIAALGIYQLPKRRPRTHPQPATTTAHGEAAATS